MNSFRFSRIGAIGPFFRGKIVKCLHTPVVQRIERMASNHKVGGSNPSRGTFIDSQIRIWFNDIRNEYS